MLSAYLLNFSSKFADILFFIILIKLIDKNTIGAYNALMAYSAFLYVAMDSGLVEASLREYAQKKATFGAIARRCAAPRLAIAAAATAILLLVPGVQAELGGVEFALYAILFQITFLAGQLGTAYLRSHGLQEFSNTVLTIESVLKLCAVAALLGFGVSDIRYIWWATIACKVVNIALIGYAIARDPAPVPVALPPQGNAWMPFNSQKYFLAIALFTLIQQRIDWLLVSHFFDDATLASYSVANRFYEIIIFVVGIGATTMYPWLCRNDSGDNSKLDSLARLQFYAGPGLIVGAILFFPFVNQHLWGNRYIEVTEYLKWLLPCLLLATGNMKLYYDMLAMRCERFVLPITIASTTLQFIFNWFAIPKLGAHGAIAGMWVLNASNLILFGLVKYHLSRASRPAFSIPIELQFGFGLALACLAGAIGLQALYLLPLAIGFFAIGVFIERSKLLRVERPS